MTVPIMRSVQRVAVTIATGQTTGTATINAVNTAASVIIYNGVNEGGTTTNVGVLYAGIVLTNGTTVTATRATSDASFACTAYCTVLEFTTTAIKSVQSGTISLLSATSGTSTITSVTTTNSAVFFTGVTSTGTTSINSIGLSLSLTNATTVTATLGGSQAFTTVGYFTVVEFNSGILNSATQQGSISCNVAAGVNATITSVTTANSMIAWGGMSHSQNDQCDQTYVQLSAATTVTAKKDQNFAATPTNFTVIEFKSGHLNSAVQRNVITIAASSASNTATITGVTLANSVINYLGSSNQASSGAVGVSSRVGVAFTLTNTTTVTLAKAAATDGNTSIGAFEVIEFIPNLSQGNMFLLM